MRADSVTSFNMEVIIIASVVTIFKYIKKNNNLIVMKFEHFKGLTLNLEVPQ